MRAHLVPQRRQPGHADLASVSDDGKRSFVYSLNLSGFGMPDRDGNPRPNPIGEALAQPDQEATRLALCPPAAKA